MELGLARLSVLAWLVAGCTPQLQPESAARAAAEKPQSVAAPSPPPDVAVAPAAPGSVEVRAQGDAVWLEQTSVEGDELVARLRERRGSTAVLSVRVEPEASDQALAEVLEAAPRAGFEQVWLGRGGETLTLATSNGDDKARILAWRSNDRFVGYDLQAAPGVSGILGPFDVATEEGLSAWRAQLARACQDPCRAELSLLPETPPRIWQTLSAWQRSAGSVTTVASRVLAIVPRPTASKPSATPAAASSAPVPPPKVKRGATTVSGRLPPRVIQHIVRSNFEKLRACYEDGLGRNSSLEGRVTIRFVIGRAGKVSNVADGGSDIPDTLVVSCVLKAMYTVEFPAPANGIVTVVYPIVFAPG